MAVLGLHCAGVSLVAAIGGCPLVAVFGLLTGEAPLAADHGL